MKDDEIMELHTKLYTKLMLNLPDELYSLWDCEFMYTLPDGKQLSVIESKRPVLEITNDARHEINRLRAETKHLQEAFRVMIVKIDEQLMRFLHDAPEREYIKISDDEWFL